MFWMHIGRSSNASSSRDLLETIIMTLARHFQIAPAILAILSLLVVPSVVGQTKGALPPLDHPEVYHSFFFFMEDFGKWLDNRAQQDPANKAKLMESAARYLKVDVSELPKVVGACQSVASKLRQIDIEAHQYWIGESVNRRTPDSGKLSSFAVQRQTAIDDGTDQLKQVLSSAGWNGLRSHINGEHRASIQRHP